jgi:hypothetical protein
MISRKSKKDQEKENKSTFLTDFIKERYIRLSSIEAMDESTIPITIRMESRVVALMDHLVEIWKDSRSGLASELLEQVIWQVFREVYKEKTNDEIYEMQLKLMREFEEKRRKGKKK